VPNSNENSEDSEVSDKEDGQEKDNLEEDDQEVDDQEEDDQEEDGQEEDDLEEDEFAANEMPDLTSEDGGLSKPLFLGGKSKSTYGEALINLGNLFKKHSCTKSLFRDIIGLVYSVMPEKSLFPSSLYRFYQLIEEHTVKKISEPDISYNCAKCLHDFGQKPLKQCPNCNGLKMSVVLNNNLEEILVHLFEKRGLAKLIEEYNSDIESHVSGTFRDVVDGAKYQSIENKSKWDVTLIYNTDGFPVSGSSKAQVWPNLLTICELRPNLRSYFMITQSIYYSPVKPNMLKFLVPSLVNALEKLGTVGFNWTHPQTGEEINSKCRLICASVDAQARFVMQSLTPYNSSWGCSFCVIKGKRVKSGKGSAHIYPFEHKIYEERTSKNMYLNAASIIGDENVQRARASVNAARPKSLCGVQGFAHLSRVGEPFDLGSGFSPEILHSCLLGVVRRQLYLITNSGFSQEDYSIVKFQALISNKLCSITPPSTCKRLPRSLEDVKFWKGSEMRAWLLYYSLPCLEKYWPVEFLRHHSLLVYGIHTLLKDSLTAEEINFAEKALKKYAEELPILYNKVEEQTYNLHLVCFHYAQSARYLGPLFAHSAFVFESANFKLGQTIHSTGHIVATELHLTSLIHNFTNVLSYKYKSSKEYKSFSSNEKYIKYLGAQVVVSAIGEEIKSTIIPTLVKKLSGRSHQSLSANCYLRASINNTTYTSENYQAAKKTRSYYALYKADDNRIACKIIYFVLVNNNKKYYFLCKNLRMISKRYASSIPSIPVEHMITFEESDEFHLILTDKLICPLLVIEGLGNDCTEKVYCVPPNMVEINL